MTDADKQIQKAGDGSFNIQARQVILGGLSYNDVKAIALDVFKQNFLKLGDQALVS